MTRIEIESRGVRIAVEIDQQLTADQFDQMVGHLLALTHRYPDTEAVA